MFKLFLAQRRGSNVCSTLISTDSALILVSPFLILATRSPIWWFSSNFPASRPSVVVTLRMITPGPITFTIKLRVRIRSNMCWRA